jgi:putative pyruvate formate lyase activating enzyme
MVLIRDISGASASDGASQSPKAHLLRFGGIWCGCIAGRISYSDSMSKTNSEPAYLDLAASGELAARAEQARCALRACRLCGHRCLVDRRDDAMGQCLSRERAVVHGYGPHHGEEHCLRGDRGSGAVFFSRCNLACVFCQNHEISARGDGEELDAEGLAGVFLRLQEWECHNLNLVTPTHQVPAILEALVVGAARGLRLPLVWNTGGYETLEAMTLLDGVVDVYLPDFKYGDSDTALRFSGAPGYWETATAAIREMHRQVGDLVLDSAGLARRGLLVRHLVLPGGLSGIGRVVQFLAREVSPRTAFNLMDQYRPCHRAGEFPPLNRRLTVDEWRAAELVVREAGLLLV